MLWTNSDRRAVAWRRHLGPCDPSCHETYIIARMHHRKRARNVDANVCTKNVVCRARTAPPRARRSAERARKNTPRASSSHILHAGFSFHADLNAILYWVLRSVCASSGCEWHASAQHGHEPLTIRYHAYHSNYRTQDTLTGASHLRLAHRVNFSKRCSARRVHGIVRRFAQWLCYLVH